MKIILGAVIIGFCLSCGPTFEEREMQNVKDTFCEDVLEEAQLAEQRGIELSPEEKAAVLFCESDNK